MMLSVEDYPLQAEGRVVTEPQGRCSAWAVYSSLIALRSGSLLKSARDISSGKAN